MYAPIREEKNDTHPTMGLSNQGRVAKFNIGITHVFSCINICRVPRKLFEHKIGRVLYLF